jgi:hypothetical protein
MLTCLTIAVLTACADDNPTGPEGLTASDAMLAESVDDLVVVAASDSSVELRWTQVSDGVDRAALYRVKYAPPSLVWATATVGCNSKGKTIGESISCTVTGLDPATTYDFQLMSHRLVDRRWEGGAYSNVAKGTTLSKAGEAVRDLAITETTTSSLRVQWTQIGYGSAGPALYRVKYAAAPMSWSAASTGCDTSATGAQAGAPMSCTITGLTPGVTYDVQLMSYHVVDTLWQSTELSNLVTGTLLPNADPVSTLSITSATDTTLTLRWTEVSDGRGSPASYVVRYSVPPLDWRSSGTVGCESTMEGTSIGAERSCTIRGLSADTDYEVQVVSYRNVAGVAEGEVPSNVVSGRTLNSVAAQQPAAGIWISPAEIASLPMSGPAWTGLLAEASRPCGAVDLSDQAQRTNVCVMAKALVFARTGTPGYRGDVVNAIEQIVRSGTYSGRALAIARELGAYAVAADIIGLGTFDPALDSSFRAKLRELRTTFTSEGPANLIQCHEKRPNNWGTHCGATRAAIAAYLGDTADLARAAQVLKGFLGDRSSYAGFAFGGPEDDLTWQCDATRPVGINPAGCVRDGRVLDGVLPDDQRRGGTYSWPAPSENYVWEALQGVIGQAVILERAGYPVWEWEDRAILRAVTWLYEVNGYPPAGDDIWLAHVVNRAYGTSFAAPVPALPGTNFGWSDWTHR